MPAAFRGLQHNDFNLRALAFQIATHTGNGTRGAHAGHKMRNTTSSLLPDFRAGGGEVRIGVIQIIEPIQHLAQPLLLHLQR